MNTFQQPAHVRNHRDDANLPILCSGIGIAFECNSSIGEVTIGTKDASRFAFSSAAISQEFNKVSAVLAESAASRPHLLHKSRKLIVFRQLQYLLPHPDFFDFICRVAVTSACIKCDFKNLAQRPDRVVEERGAILFAK